MYTGNPDRRTWTAELYASAELHRSTKRISFVTSFAFTIILLIALIVIVWFVFEYTKFGFYCKCIGENERTVHSVGINVKKIRIICFMISGLMAGIIGLVQICRVGGSTSTLCNMLEMKVQMAIFLGGILTTGGFSAKNLQTDHWFLHNRSY